MQLYIIYTILHIKVFETYSAFFSIPHHNYSIIENNDSYLLAPGAEQLTIVG